MFEQICLKVIRTLKLLETLSAVRTPNRGFAPGPTRDFRPQTMTVCRRGEGVPEHPLSRAGLTIVPVVP